MNVGEYFRHLGETQTSSIVCFFIFFIPLYALTSWKPKIPWIFIFCIVGILFGVGAKEDNQHHWRPPLLNDKYNDMDAKDFFKVS